MAGTWLEARSERFFFGQNFRILARKSVFCYRTPDFVNGPFVALGDSFDLAPSDWFLNFWFPSYGVSLSGLRPENLHFLRYTHVTRITWAQTDPNQWDHYCPISWGNSGYNSVFGRWSFFLLIAISNFSTICSYSPLIFLGSDRHFFLLPCGYKMSNRSAKSNSSFFLKHPPATPWSTTVSLCSAGLWNKYNHHNPYNERCCHNQILLETSKSFLPS